MTTMKVDEWTMLPIQLRLCSMKKLRDLHEVERLYEGYNDKKMRQIFSLPRMTKDLEKTLQKLRDEGLAQGRDTTKLKQLYHKVNIKDETIWVERTIIGEQRELCRNLIHIRNQVKDLVDLTGTSAEAAEEMIATIKEERAKKLQETNVQVSDKKRPKDKEQITHKHMLKKVEDGQEHVTQMMEAKIEREEKEKNTKEEPNFKQIKPIRKEDEQRDDYGYEDYTWSDRIIVQTVLETAKRRDKGCTFQHNHFEKLKSVLYHPSVFQYQGVKGTGQEQ